MPENISLRGLPLRVAVAHDSSVLTRKLSEASAVNAIGLGKRMPSSTKITAMLKPSVAATLTPAAKQLTKDDLVKMQEGNITAAAKGLTVRDIASIQNAFKGSRGGMAATDVSCCCCTPCCCAAAVETEAA